MKWSLAALVFVAVAVMAQNEPARAIKHVLVPTMTNVRASSAAAFEIEREGQYPAIIHLKGNVEIKTPVCVAVGPGSGQACDGYVVLHADEADFHEDTGQIDARGNVQVTRETKRY